MDKTCSRCRLSETRRNTVWGKGKIPNKYLIIGECPSKSDDLLNESLTGPSGKLLEDLLTRSGIDIEDCYFNCRLFSDD